MKSKSNKYLLYTIILIIIAGVLYTACKDVTPNSSVLEKQVELKYNK